MCQGSRGFFLREWQRHSNRIGQERKKEKEYKTNLEVNILKCTNFFLPWTRGAILLKATKFLHYLWSISSTNKMLRMLRRALKNFNLEHLSCHWKLWVSIFYSGCKIIQRCLYSMPCHSQYLLTSKYKYVSVQNPHLDPPLSRNQSFYF